MTQIDQIIADALAGSPETHVAILAREVVRLREARAVVVPNFSDAEAGALAWENGYDDDNYKARDLVKAAWAYARLNSRAIPADRVLGEGEIKGRPEDLARTARDAVVDWMDDSNATPSIEECIVRSLRASQGGADHD